MARSDTQTIGNNAERVAHRYLKKHGLKSVEENFRCRLGEVDLIMLDSDCLVFVEVRFRTTRQNISARDSVDYRKQSKLVKTAAMFLTQNKRFAQHTIRFDVIAVDGDSLEWICDAFRPVGGHF